MKAMRVLLTSQAGSPDNPSTWSGTPAHLVAALREGGRIEPVAWSSVLAGGTDRWVRRVDTALRLRHGSIYGPVRRAVAGARAVAAARRMDCSAILHFGTYDIPLRTAEVPSYLYVDNTYDIWERQSSAARRLSPFQRYWFRRLERFALCRVRHIFTVGEHVADNFATAFAVKRERLTAVGTGLGAVRPYEGPKDYGRKRLLIVAKQRPHDKGLPLLLQGFALARRQEPMLQLTVVGGAGNPEVAGMEGVHATGWISAEELQRLFEDSALFVMPATYEPWGLSYLEALACRTPVVGLAQNALPEITASGKFGFLLEEPTPERLAETLLQALADSARLERMGLEGQRHCLARYRWDTIASRMADVITQGIFPPA